MTIDTEIRHVIKPGANLFLELGFDHADAVHLQAKSHQHIHDTRAIKEQLMGELSKWIDENHLKQADAAEILKISRPRVSDVVNKNISKFTIDALVDMLSRIGKPVAIGQAFVFGSCRISVSCQTSNSIGE
jgi:predicted XRE-type DNA-binding protein